MFCFMELRFRILNMFLPLLLGFPCDSADKESARKESDTTEPRSLSLFTSPPSLTCQYPTSQPLKYTLTTCYNRL